MRDVAKVNVTVKLLAHLMWYPEQKQVTHTLSVEEGTSVGILMDLLNVPPEQVRAILRNGESVDADTPVRAGDEIAYFPMIVGG